jgi:putative membrane protein
MIIYRSNEGWVRDIRHLARSWTMQKILRAVGVVGLGTLIICVVELEVLHIQESMMVSSIYSLLGIVLSILLVFRTNSAYDRWWEGRKQWGALVNDCRNLAVSLQTCLPHNEIALRKLLARDIGNFCIALKEHLRNGAKIDELSGLSPEEQAEYAARQHLPGYLSLRIHSHIQTAFHQGLLTEADMINIKPNLRALLDITGACERIKKTPIPFSYNVYIKLFITAYTLLLPFGFAAELGYWAVPLVMLVFFAFIGVEMMGEEIEDPFGLDCNDLPTGDIALTIQRNVCEILEDTTLLRPVPERQLYDKVF